MTLIELARKRRRALLHAPATLRALVRGSEIFLVLLAACVGGLAGLLVVGMNQSCQLAHEMLYGLASGSRLSAQDHVVAWRAFAALAGGGLGMGLVNLALSKFRPVRPVDPIEANALYGGQMSFIDSALVVGQTMLSNGCGASVGLEAGYSQIGAAVASKIGGAFRVRRADLRLLVGCGAAGAIASAFNAPLTGAFYAFELVIGTYTLTTLAPVVAAAISAVMVQRLILGDEPGYDVSYLAAMHTIDFLPLAALAVLCALVGIAIMYGVTLFERAFAAIRLPGSLRPVLGGIAVAGLALASPAVLSAGHGALRDALTAAIPLHTLLLLLGMKALASAISLGAGFRGGLFFASLFLGALLGKAFAAIMLFASPAPVFPDPVYGLVGMSGLATAIIGGPLTMSFLALESTGSLPLTVAVLATSVISSIAVRRTFGYSFATWRFHLRGETIRSAVDVGWMRMLTVGRMMRADVRTVPQSDALSVFRRAFPLGSANRVVALNAQGRYAGLVWVADAHAAAPEIEQVAGIVHHAHDVLTPEMTVKEAARAFERAEADALAVVDSVEDMRVVGLLTEQHALRRYSDELERRRRDLSGE